VREDKVFDSDDSLSESTSNSSMVSLPDAMEESKLGWGIQIQRAPSAPSILGDIRPFS